MIKYKLQYKNKLTKQQSRGKICANAMFGNHNITPRPTSVEQVQKYFIMHGINTDILTEEFRNPKKIVPNFENLLRSTWKTNGDNGFTVSLVDNDDTTVSSISKPGIFIWSNYEAHFEAACSARDRAVEKSSYQDFLECLSQGFASIESFFKTRAEVWNKKHPDDLFIDSTTHKVSIEDKIDQWLPKMSGGKKLDKSSRVWNDFKICKRIRDDTAIHPKLPGQAISWEEFAKQINCFRLGIAQLLANMHVDIGIFVPSVIINAIYTPDVEVVTESKK